MKPPHLKSKRKKTAILSMHPSLKKYVPKTVSFSRSHLYEMLSQYQTVYVKPDRGRFGRGVMKITQQSNRYKLQYLRRTNNYNTLATLFISIKKMTSRKKYIVQQGIHMLTQQQRPFDIRVMVQRSLADKWETTGILARVAAPGKVVTNYHAGGSIRPLPPLLASYMPKKDRLNTMHALRILGYRVARHYSKQLKGLNEIGIDVALDRKFKPWILEVNTRPDAFVFNALKNKKMFQRIIRNARGYGKYRNSQMFRREFL